MYSETRASEVINRLRYSSLRADRQHKCSLIDTRSNSAEAFGANYSAGPASLNDGNVVLNL